MIISCDNTNVYMGRTKLAQLVTRDSEGKLFLYTFNSGSNTFEGKGEIGHGFIGVAKDESNNDVELFREYFFGAFDGSMYIPDDLVVAKRDVDNEGHAAQTVTLLLYPYDSVNNTLGTGRVVGHVPLDITNYLPGQWDNTPGTDLIVRRNQRLYFYPFRDGQFQEPDVEDGNEVGHGFSFPRPYYFPSTYRSIGNMWKD